jgi:hypothetical protein
MSQLIENKQNHPVLIANFEPNEIARKSACPRRREEKAKIQTRKHCADKPTQEVEKRRPEYIARMQLPATASVTGLLSDFVNWHRAFISVAGIHSLVAIFHSSLRPNGQRQIIVGAGLFAQVAHQTVE